jgi:hypothetical protein
MSKCTNCEKRKVQWCDKHGGIPAEMVEKEINCPDFAPFEDAELVLKRWAQGVDQGSIEHIYINALLDGMSLMRISDQLDAAVCWLYSLPDSKGVRAVQHSVQVFDTRELPI